MQARGKYKTRQKEAVQAFFVSQPQQCFSAEEIYEHLTGQGMDVGKTTIYRAITNLCEEGVLRRYAPTGVGDAAYYQYNPCNHHHLHIRCVSCGTLAHIDCNATALFCQHISSHHHFELDEGQTVLMGRCKQCTNEK